MNDLISRQAAIKAIRASALKYTGFMEMEMYTDDDAVEAISILPSAEPERKKGKWIDEGQYAEGHSEHAYYCSKCGNEYIGYIGEYNFCPNCRAEMREG